MKGLMLRLSTGIVFVAVMLGGLLGGIYPFLLLFAVITSGCLWEFYGLTKDPSESQAQHRQRKILALLVGLVPYLYLVGVHLKWWASDTALAHAFLLYLPLAFALFLYELFQTSELPFTKIANNIIGHIYIGLPFAALQLLAFWDGTFDTSIILGLLILTWTNDTAAYLVGSQIGKTPLFPRISPKKTWEGTMGGVLICLGMSYLLSRFYPGIAVSDWLILGLIVVVFGSLGDLVESMLKRSLKIKDSGNLLPGHGGMLDRFDAFIFLIPFAAAYVLLMR